MKTIFRKTLPITAIAVMLLSACSSTQTAAPYEPDQQLNALLAQHQVSAGSDLECNQQPQRRVDCHTLANQLGALTLSYPHHSEINVIAALVYFQTGRTMDSQLLLDKVLSQAKPMPEAAILRSQIAMQEGNINLARTLLNRQLQLVPDHPELYAALASTYYLEGRYEQSQNLLQTADRLGAPAWRTSYHLGLLHEAQQHWPTACQYYVATLNRLPRHAPSLSRLLALSEHPACNLAYNTL